VALIIQRQANLSLLNEGVRKPQLQLT
jgi:hypothetical protein